MKIKILTETSQGNETWADFNIPNEIVDGVLAEGEEYNILVSGQILTVKDCSNLITFLNYKFRI